MCSYPYHDLRPEHDRRLQDCRDRCYWGDVHIPLAEMCPAFSTEADEKMLAEIAAKPEVEEMY